MKLCAGTATVSAMVVVAVKAPEMPVIVIVEVPPVQPVVLLSVSVITLVPVVGLVLNAAVSPVGNPDAASVTLPVNPPKSVTVIVSMALLPGVTDKEDADGVSVKPALAGTVSAMVVVAVCVPDVPVMVTVAAPTVAVLLAVSVSTLVLAVGLVAKAAVTPAGRPVAVRVTEPVNGLTSVTVMVSVTLVPWTIDKVAAEGLSVKLPDIGETPLTEQAVPLRENAAGTELMVPFHVPLNPMPARLPPAAILPL